MNVAIIGYGKMGKEIEKVLISRGHNICKIIKKDDKVTFDNCEIAIIFTSPESTYEQIINCLNSKIKVVCGSTGWTKMQKKVENYCLNNGGTFLFSPNFSIGVNLFYKLNDYMSSIMSNHKDYTASILEKHHTEKADKPSGTALKIADDIISKSNYDNWTNENIENNKLLKIISKRDGNNKGHHSVIYESEDDLIRLSHTAKSRFGFALGAVLSAEFLKNKKGLFKFDDVINNLNNLI